MDLRDVSQPVIDFVRKVRTCLEVDIEELDKRLSEEVENRTDELMDEIEALKIRIEKLESGGVK